MTSNTLLTIGTLALLGVFTLASNSLIADNSRVSAESEYYVTAISLGQSVIDEAKGKAFDQKTVAATVAARESLTTTVKLGKDGAGEAVPTTDTVSATGYRSTAVFNDVDDYNSYVRRVNTRRNGNYLVSVNVSYASETYPDSLKATQTYCKKMSVTVTNPLMSRAVTLGYSFTY